MKQIFSFLTALMITSPVWSADDMYTVRNVEVDVKAESAAAAEHKAMQTGRAKAFKMLVDRIVPEDQRGSLNNVPQETLEDLVDSVEVNNQKNSKTRYIAKMTFFFDGNAVQNYLSNRTISAVEQAKQPLVVVPLYIDQGGINLWGEQNPWLEAWSKRDKLSAVTPIVVPMGDLKDIATIDGPNIMKGELGGLKELARRYGGAGVVLATMRRDSPNPMSPMSFEASLYTLDGQSMPLGQARVSTTQGEPKFQFDQAIDQIVKQLEGQARQESTFLNAHMEGQLMARVQLEDPRSWFVIQNTLKNSPEVKNLDVKGLTKRQATVLLSYRGTPASLESDLGSRGLQLEQLDGQTWLIRLQAPTTSSPY